MTIQGPEQDEVPETITVSYEDGYSPPREHNGSDAFEFRIRLSEGPPVGTGEDGFSYTDIKDHVVKVTEGGSERGATWVGRLNAPNNDRWKIRVEPETYGDITVEIVETTDCSADGAVCKEGRMLSPGISAVVRGPIAMSVADVPRRPRKQTRTWSSW